MKTIKLTDAEAEVLAHHISERLQRLNKNMESTTQMAVIEDAQKQRDFYSQLLKQLGYEEKDLENKGILLRKMARPMAHQFEIYRFKRWNKELFAK